MKTSAFPNRLLLALLVGSGTPLMAQEPPAPAAQPAAEPEKPKDPIVCKRTQVTGTRMGSQRECKPQSQWDIQERELDEMRRRVGEIRPNSG